eukprot:1146844-Prymnesium_polylepis.1
MGYHMGIRRVVAIRAAVRQGKLFGWRKWQAAHIPEQVLGRSAACLPLVHQPRLDGRAVAVAVRLCLAKQSLHVLPRRGPRHVAARRVA